MLIHDFTVYWESYLKSDRPHIHQRVLCAGYAKVKAKTEKDAARIWKLMFPYDKIVKIS